MVQKTWVLPSHILVLLGDPYNELRVYDQVPKVSSVSEEPTPTNLLSPITDSKFIFVYTATDDNFFLSFISTDSRLVFIHSD